ncbi:MAG: hypothetical protein CMA72_09010 [Euryarchaeota archaeon]|nr:hypothetical protein [Euryarchaeota archaeon]
MKKLFPKQEEAKSFFASIQKSKKNTLDTSHAGTGKTVVAAQLAKELGTPVFVLCPKSVIHAWGEELDEAGVCPLGIINFEKVRGGRTTWMRKKGKSIMTWYLPKDTLVLIDEVHKCKGPYTLNAQLVISLHNQGYRIHAMSATAAEDPTEMRSLGFMLGLHGLNKADHETVPPQKSWYSWMKHNGCEKDFWNQWNIVDTSKLRHVRETMYDKNTKRLDVSDLPKAFRRNRIFTDYVEFKNASKIKKAYADLGITPDIVKNYIESGKLPVGEHHLTNIMYARQLAEGLKAPDIADMAEDLMLEGMSVVVFVNFRETVEALCGRLKCDRIEGGQKSNRDEVIKKFQEDETNCIVCNIAAGGTGISLHDKHGNRPRASLISPTFSAKDLDQVLGRIHRNGMQTDALQKILVAKGSIEEQVLKSMSRRRDNLRIMQNKG